MKNFLGIFLIMLFSSYEISFETGHDPESCVISTAHFGLSVPTHIMKGTVGMLYGVGIHFGDVSSICFDTMPVHFFTTDNDSAWYAFLPVSVKELGMIKTVTITLIDGQTIVHSIDLDPRANAFSQMSRKTPHAVNNELHILRDSLCALQETTADTKLWHTDFRMPLRSNTIHGAFGTLRKYGDSIFPHGGVDLIAKIGTKIYAASDGIILAAGDYGPNGNMVIIDHGGGVTSWYLHMSKINVSVGQMVNAGECIGLVGKSGHALGPHLHFTMKVEGITVDPIQFIAMSK